MKKVVLVHWDIADAKARAKSLERSGYRVTCFPDETGGDVRSVRKDPPDAFIVDLNRAPSQGRSVAVWLRQQKATRRVPIVFIEGDPKKTEAARKALPDAVYTGWQRIRGVLRRAIDEPPERPVVPGTMDAYAGATLIKKLGIKAGTRLALLGAPKGFGRALGKLPADVTIKTQARGTADVIVLFVGSVADLNKRFPAAGRTLVDGGRLWIAWPKRTSGVASDLTQAVVRSTGLGAGWVDYKISAIDDTWSALCFTQRHRRTRSRTAGSRPV